LRKRGSLPVVLVGNGGCAGKRSSVSSQVVVVARITVTMVGTSSGRGSQSMTPPSKYWTTPSIRRVGSSVQGCSRLLTTPTVLARSAAGLSLRLAW
jgi:hypothetical protein